MLFNEFIQKFASVLREGLSTGDFARKLLKAILSEKGKKIVDNYSKDTLNRYYNGTISISGIAKRINSYVDKSVFESYIYDLGDAETDNLVSVFNEDIPSITQENAKEKLSDLFFEIIKTASCTSKKTQTKKTMISHKENNEVSSDISPKIPSDESDEIDSLNKEWFSIINDLSDIDFEVNPFSLYLQRAIEFFSTKKTLLYAESPHPFYELYVCNNITYIRYNNDTRQTIINATIEKLEAESKYVIIQGTGGIGKSMLLTHLFLSTAKQADQIKKTPVLILLKNYKDSPDGMVGFISKSIQEFDCNISKEDIIHSLQKKQLILLLDGLDEVQTSLKDNFNQELETFIKSYPDNTIVLTSRPIFSFISFTKFSLFNIQPLTKEQAIELIEKLQFWNKEGKKNFLYALNHKLYHTHREFASNPLLLTIMLMTYSENGEIPTVRHVFYSKAYEVMARLHDASKGSFKRPLHTDLTPEEFAKYFSQFCARTYEKELIEFDDALFNEYMTEVIMKKQDYLSIAPRDFLLDLTDNLCIMYHENNHYYFIHRSFQEYFAAVYFASCYDYKFEKISEFFEENKKRSETDKTFDMLYEMIPEKIERFIYFPFLEKLITSCMNKNGYWEFLKRIYPRITYNEGDFDDNDANQPKSFIYQFIIKTKIKGQAANLSNFTWPKKIYDLYTITWVEVYSDYYDLNDDEDFNYAYTEDCLNTTMVDEEMVSISYRNYFGDPEKIGISIEIDIKELMEDPLQYGELIRFMEGKNFPLMQEYLSIKDYYYLLKKKYETNSHGLFDD